MVGIVQQAKPRRNKTTEIVVRKVEKLNGGGIDEVGRKGENG